MSVSLNAAPSILPNFGITPKRIAKAALLSAIPLSIIAIISRTPTASGGPITYAACVAGCEALAAASTGGPGAAAAIQACIHACLPVLSSPTP